MCKEGRVASEGLTWTSAWKLMSPRAAVPDGVSREEAQLLKEAIIMVRKQNEMKRSQRLFWKTGRRWGAPEGTLIRIPPKRSEANLWSVTGRERKMFGLHRQQLQSRQTNTNPLNSFRFLTSVSSVEVASIWE